MKTTVKTKLAVLAATGLLGLGVGIPALSNAFAAQSNPANSTPPVNIQQQDQQQATSPKADTDKEVKDANEAPEKESATEAKNEVEEDKNLPGGGHQDPDGANVDHQFEGVE